jgi:hypothetical protein
MSTNILLEELLCIKNNYKIYFGCTGIDCFDSKFLRHDRGGIGFGSNFGQTRERYFE